MKNIWRDYWKGQTYNASALSGCCYLKHPDVFIANYKSVINIKKLEEYNLKVYPSFQLNNVLIYSFNSNFQVKHAISAAKFL